METKPVRRLLMGIGMLGLCITILPGCDILEQARIKATFVEDAEWRVDEPRESKGLKIIESLAREYGLHGEECHREARLWSNYFGEEYFGPEWRNFYHFCRTDGGIGPQLRVATSHDRIEMTISIWAHAPWQMRSYNGFKKDLFAKLRTEFGYAQVWSIDPYWPDFPQKGP